MTVTKMLLDGAPAVVPLATFWNDPQDPDWGGQAVHDVCAVAYLSRPELFTTVPARVEVETSGDWTAGMTVTDFRSSIPNAVVPVKLDVDGFWDYVLEQYALVSPPPPPPGQLSRVRLGDRHADAVKPGRAIRNHI